MLLSDFLSSPLSKKSHLVVLGHPVSHSRSPQIHNLALQEHSLDITYHAIDCPKSQWELIPELFSSPFFYGANITIPLKKEVIRFMDELDEPVREIGAMNTVVPAGSGPDHKYRSISGPNRLKGYNTDTYGFLKPLEAFLPFPVVVILGTGGASQAIRYALSKAGTQEMYLVSRSAVSGSMIPAGSMESGVTDVKKNTSNASCYTISYSDLDEIVQKADLIINTTPIGMFPDTDSMPVTENILAKLKDKTCYDIIYNPLETKFLHECKKSGARILGGLDMFIYQAVRSFSLWFDKPMPVERIRNLLRDEMAQGTITR